MERSPVVSTGWLADRLGDPGLRVFDTSFHLDPGPKGLEMRSGRAGYEAKHAPGAGFLDIVADLSEPDAELAFTRPRPERLARVLARAGIGADHHVVLYSAGSVMWATRAWWLLRSVGLASVSVLDGGFAKWEAEGRPVSVDPCVHPEAGLEARPVDDVWASTEEVLRATTDGGACVLNALPRALHSGAASLGYQRRGRIRGSENVPFTELEEEDGTFRLPAELREHFGATRALTRERVICYCGGGIAATQNAFALRLVGHPNVAVYDGSLNEWSRDPALPMDTEASG
ncbi:MAG: sulfurtransferase [Myxococcota bacterium]